MIVSKKNYRADSLKVLNDHTFERVKKFKYLGADFNKDANTHENIKRRLISANRCYYGLIPHTIVQVKIIIKKIQSNLL